MKSDSHAARRLHPLQGQVDAAGKGAGASVQTENPIQAGRAGPATAAPRRAGRVGYPPTAPLRHLAQAWLAGLRRPSGGCDAVRGHPPLQLSHDNGGRTLGGDSRCQHTWRLLHRPRGCCGQQSRRNTRHCCDVAEAVLDDGAESHRGCMNHDA